MTAAATKAAIHVNSAARIVELIKTHFPRRWQLADTADRRKWFEALGQEVSRKEIDRAYRQIKHEPKVN